MGLWPRPLLHLTERRPADGEVARERVPLRTGNAWVHAIGYHAIAPHVMVDAPLMAKVFGLR